MSDPADPAHEELRRALRALPVERRRALVRAVREGRAVDDPRDAALAVAWAHRVQAFWWPGWVLPRTRPYGRRAALWLLHAAWLIGAFVVAAVRIGPLLGDVFEWVFVGAIAYGIISVPWALALILPTRWNAPEAERRNRELLRSTAEGGDRASAALPDAVARY